MEREIIEINKELCNGCGACVPGCEEGALKIVNGKARLVGEVYCDGLGACLGHCPTGALTIARREAPAFDPEAVARLLATGGDTASDASNPSAGGSLGCGCPSSAMQTFAASQDAGAPSGLGHWPVKIRLLPPDAPFLEGADIVIAADCAPVAMPDFHDRIRGKVGLIGCPKFDDVEKYARRFAAMFENASIASATVLEMEVPCCHGLHRVVAGAMRLANADFRAEREIVSRRGKTTRREPIQASLPLAAL